MKTKTFLLSLFMCFTGLQNFAQSISNAGFESWSTLTYFEEPLQFETTNFLSYFGTGQANAVKTTDAFSGSFALKLTTIDSPDGILPGGAFVGAPGEGGFSGGMPFTSRPDSLTGFVKYNIQPQDTAYAAIIFKKFGAPLGICFATFVGTQSGYQQFSQAVDWLIPIISPDSMAVLLISSAIFSQGVTGSTITMDNLQFVGGSDTFPNGDFENWESIASEEPDSWFTANNFTLPAGNTSVEKTADSYSGNWAVKITNTVTVWGDTIGFITNGQIGDPGPVGGMPVENIPDVLSGYYKYTPVGNDTAIAGMWLYRYNPQLGVSEILDSAFALLPATSTYTYFEVPVAYNVWPEPDTLNIAFGSGNFDNGSYVGLGSSLWIDDLNLTYKPSIVGMDEKPADFPVNIYPNPAHQQLFVSWGKILNKPLNIEVLNSQGQVLISKSFGVNHMQAEVDIEQLSPGIYFYRLRYDDKTTNGKLIVK